MNTLSANAVQDTKLQQNGPVKKGEKAAVLVEKSLLYLQQLLTAIGLGSNTCMSFEKLAKYRWIGEIQVMGDLRNTGIRIMQAIPGFQQYLVIDHFPGCLSG